MKRTMVFTSFLFLAAMISNFIYGISNNEEPIKNFTLSMFLGILALICAVYAILLKLSENDK